MREVFVHQDSARVGLYKSILDEAGIATFVRNQSANNIADMPCPVFFPILCVVNDEDYDQAVEVLREFHEQDTSARADWICEKCGEEVPGGFGQCWKCAADMPESAMSLSPAPAPEALESKPTRAVAADARFVANVFRWLIIVSAVFELVWYFFGASFSCAPPENVSEYLAGLSHGGSVNGIAAIAVRFRFIAWPITLILGFTFAPIARPFAVLAVCAQMLALLQDFACMWQPVTAMIYQPFSALPYIITTMMFLPPLRRHFTRIRSQDS